MIRNTKRSIRLLSWRTLRWAIAIPSLPLVWWACTSHPLAQPTPAPEQQTDIYISVSPTRLLDLVFMVDNSPSMAPKVTKLNAQFPKLIAALKDPNDGTLPDLRVAIIDSDLGTGGAYQTSSCGPKTLPAPDDPSGQISSPYGDMGRFQMIGATDCGVTNPNATYLEYLRGTPGNFKGDINTVFACLAGNLGTLGCGEEHQLQAFEFALVAGGLGKINDDQHKMLRGNAYLGLVFLTDEDDCSAAPNDGMFGDKPELRNESASLRCYSRSHICNGKNLADSPPGYPTDKPFTSPLSACSARTDSCTLLNPVPDDAQPTQCSPLKDIHALAQEIKGLKEDPDNQILVAGIFGWPLSDADMKNAVYKIDQIPNPNAADTAHPTVFDSWPICYDPAHKPADPNTFDKDAAGIGATAGLRNAAFIDEFGPNGLKFSICQTDFAASMKVIGDAIAKHLQNLCVDYKLWTDPDPNSPNYKKPSCRVAYRNVVIDPNNPSAVTYTEDPTGMPQCDPGATSDNISKDCWRLDTDKNKCPDAYNGQVITVVRTRESLTKEPQLPAGTKVGMQCRTCTDFMTPDPDPNSPTFGQKIPLPGC